MSLEPTSVADIRYKCPVCLTALFPPVFQCDNGHLLCGPCLSRLANCAICRISFPRKRKVRNLEVERIIRMIQHPCPNEDDGCSATLNFDQLEDHRLECKYTKLRICKKVLGIKCEDKCSIADYEKHTETVHGQKFYNIQSKSLPVLYSYYKNVHNVRQGSVSINRIQFMFEGKATLVMLTIRRDQRSDFLTWRPYVFAARAVTNKLECKVAISNGRTDKIVFQSPIYNPQTEPADLESCCTLSFKYWKTLANEESGDCHIKVEISEKKEGI